MVGNSLSVSSVSQNITYIFNIHVNADMYY